MSWRERERERGEKNALYSGHLRLCQQPRAAHALRSDQKNASLVKCGQCKVKSTLTGMKMHLKTAHSSPKPQRSNKTVTKAGAKDFIQPEFKCDNGDCGYKSYNRMMLMQHIDAIHLIPWKLRLEKSSLSLVKCNRCDALCESSKLDQHIEEHHRDLEEEELIKDYPNEVEEISLD
jgi:hypothetical protein